MKTIAIILMLFCPAIYGQVMPGQTDFPVPKIPYNPKHYVCYRALGPVNLDENLDQGAWKNAPWTDYFEDIQGSSMPTPRFKTKVKMLWDDNYLYVGADLQEPNLWAALRQRDTVIFCNNDFEVFIDPNGATQPYYETEVNALGTVWDLLLRLPYHDGDKAAVNAWDITGLKVKVTLHGTLNNPFDVDSGWTVELAFPWTILGECAFDGAPPKPGSQCRINFSRVEWHLAVENVVYHRERNAATAALIPEDNWVWSPQGLIDMHYPEMWGFVQFSDKIAGEGHSDFKWNPVENAKWVLREIYYGERNYYIAHGTFSSTIAALDLSQFGLTLKQPGGFSWPPEIYTTPDMFEALIKSQDRKETVHIRQDGMTWITHRDI